MKTKRLSSAIAIASLLTLSGLGVSIELGTIQPMPAVAQATTCYPTVISASFSAKAASGGVNIRSGPSLSASIVRVSASNETLYFDGWTHRGDSDTVKDLWLKTPDARWYKLRGQNAWVASAVVMGNPSGSTAMPSSPCGGGGGSGQINLPFRSGQTWYVCQGYQGPWSHSNTHSFDLTVAREDVGSTGCWPANGNFNKSTGQSVLAPAAGTVAYVDSDLVCLTIDSGHSLLIGHLNRTVANGARVNQDTQLGTVSQAGTGRNGGYAHIHIEARNGAGCPLPQGDRSVPFIAANQFQFNGIGDLPNLLGTSDYQGKGLTRR